MQQELTPAQEIVICCFCAIALILTVLFFFYIMIPMQKYKADKQGGNKRPKWVEYVDDIF